MKQTTFASLNFAAKKKPTRREQFLSEMAKVVPWVALEALLEPHYPKSVGVVAHRCHGCGCCAFTSCSNGTH